jgi:hypothetical protein
MTFENVNFNNLFIFQTINNISKIRIDPKSHDKEKIDDDNFLLCKFCRNIITSKNHSINIDEKHIHTFKNPMGLVFTIGSFSQAKGCLKIGEPTSQFTWFPGYEWSITLCNNCMIHLGWYYQSGSSGFFGLILDNLIENK